MEGEKNTVASMTAEKRDMKPPCRVLVKQPFYLSEDAAAKEAEQPNQCGE